MGIHEIYMQRCIDLAKVGKGYVDPNPMVGAVIVHQDRIIGEGFHRQYGHPHAEVNAINMVLERYTNSKELLRQSQIYVSLEPCAHYGKTPPCADLIIKYQIPEVIIGSADPFSEVAGKGIEKLKQAGINVISGILEKECRELNKRFFTRITKQRPYIILKWAQTRNGVFAPLNQQQFWITSLSSRKMVHQWRSEENAILVGKNTALADNPKLNVRYHHGKSPVRIVIDRNLELPGNLNLFDQSVETLVFNQIESRTENKIKYIALEDFNNYVPHYILYQLYLRDIQSVIIEGGAETLNRFIKENLWDEARIFTGATELEEGIPAPEITGSACENYQVGVDQLQIIYNIKN
jgi:diaminohydroxyphosphoribosylaminopyrimidine deaminase/5-amino-6-(5-phosphoribosylamino)uracil reductase